jgi:hypothetical protein
VTYLKCKNPSLFDYEGWPREYKLKMTDVSNILNGGPEIHVIEPQVYLEVTLQQRDNILSDDDERDKIAYSGTGANVTFKLSLSFVNWLEKPLPLPLPLPLTLVFESYVVPEMIGDGASMPPEMDNVHIAEKEDKKKKKRKRKVLEEEAREKALPLSTSACIPSKVSKKKKKKKEKSTSDTSPEAEDENKKKKKIKKNNKTLTTNDIITAPLPAAPDHPEQKTCSRCKEIKTRTSIDFRTSVDRGGYRGQCRVCEMKIKIINQAAKVDAPLFWKRFEKNVVNTII